MLRQNKECPDRHLRNNSYDSWKTTESVSCKDKNHWFFWLGQNIGNLESCQWGQKLSLKGSKQNLFILRNLKVNQKKDQKYIEYIVSLWCKIHLFVHPKTIVGKKASCFRLLVGVFIRVCLVVTVVTNFECGYCLIEKWNFARMQGLWMGGIQWDA